MQTLTSLRRYFLRLLLLKQSGERMLLEAGAVQPNSWDAQKMSSSSSSSLSKVITVAETLNKFRQQRRLTLLPMPQALEWYSGWACAPKPAPEGAFSPLFPE